jgi:ATP-dependent DNA helicase RecG
MNALELLDAVAAGESADWEFKSAKGGFPASLWETYSAMANTDGGTIVLGIGESDQGFVVEGLKSPQPMLKTWWDTVNNRGKVSVNLLTGDAARLVSAAGKTVLVIQVPRANRWQRPVYVGQNPLDGTFRRNYEGDYRCQADEVARMLADQSLEPADSHILPNFTMTDLDHESIRQYRNRFSARNPNHVWLNEEIPGFLQKLGGWNKQRATGEAGLTVAGLLMFGTEDALKDTAARLKYHVDYRERPTNSIADRWTDRLTPDGTWVPNLFQFFQKVYPKLTAELKLPFGYLTNPPDDAADPVRSGQSPVHEAIQEALVNALIHADYRGMGGVVVERFVDRIELSNPGTLLVSFEQLRQGAVSECRNPSLQRMFQMIGAGDKAGSGIDKIRRGWEKQQWRSPTVEETTQPDRVKVILPMVSLLQPESVARLQQLFGHDYATLTPIEVQTLVTADLEGEVSNSRLQLVRAEHPVELTKMLQGLTAKGFLEKIGEKRGSRYRIPTWASHSVDGASHFAPGASPFAPLASHLAPETSLETNPALLEIARPARDKKKLAPELTKRLLQRLCGGLYLTAEQLGTLMDRHKDRLQESFLAPMVAEGQLQLRFPDQPTHPDQAYRTNPDWSES